MNKLFQFSQRLVERGCQWIGTYPRKAGLIVAILIGLQLIELIFAGISLSTSNPRPPICTTVPHILATAKPRLHTQQDRPIKTLPHRKTVHLNLARKDATPKVKKIPPKKHVLKNKKIAPKHHKLIIKRGDSITKLLKARHMNKCIPLIIKNKKAAKALHHLTPGNTLLLESNKHGHLKRLLYTFSSKKQLEVSISGHKATVHWLKRAVKQHLVYQNVLIQSSLHSAANQHHIPNTIVAQLAHIFEHDINFSRDIRSQDRFALLYYVEDFNDKPAHYGPIIAAKFINRGKQYTAIRFVDHANTTHYYTPEGYSLERSFLRAPLQYTHISSGFSERRMHPILHHIRAHHGIDFAAPYGTPVQATANGRISFKGWKGGYGRMIMIRHNRRYTTVYGHMQRFTPHLKAGSYVKQGQIIGYVGSSGLATGPHLHYEFRINNVPRNPLTVKVPYQHRIAKRDWPSFHQSAHKWESYLRGVHTRIS